MKRRILDEKLCFIKFGNKSFAFILIIFSLQPCFAEFASDTTQNSLKQNEYYSSKEFPQWDVHFGAEITSLIHIGGKYKISDYYLLELNLAPVTPTWFGIFTVIDPSINWQFDKNNNFFLNYQLPIWFENEIFGGFELYGLFPTLNFGWFNNYKSQNLSIRGGVSYLLRYENKHIASGTPFFNIGIQFGFSNNPNKRSKG